MQVVFVAHLHQENIGLYEIHLFAKGDDVHVVFLKGVPQYPGQFPDIILGFLRILTDQRLEGIERIEQHVRVQLVFQSLVLVTHILCHQLPVLQQDFLMLPDEVADVAASGYNQAQYEIADRMQVMVYHRVDGRNIEMAVQEDKYLAGYLAQYPGQDEGKSYLPPRHAYHRPVKSEQDSVQGEKGQQGKEGITRFKQYVGSRHVRKQGLLFP